ncbi:MAG: murein DD-endopeptidase MepM/ murein hydrolase activator NlpD [Halieaceae bacterium]|jgi:murein DD-endopeptidase MepM/ murein hydrolase activator NlpD
MINPKSLNLRLVATAVLLLCSGLHLPLSACVELSGVPQEGALLWGQVAPGTEVILDGVSLPVAPSGVFVFGFHRDAKALSTLQVIGSKSCVLELDVAGREYNIQKVEGVPQRTVTPDPVHAARIKAERELVYAAKANSHEQPLFTGGFIWPLQGPITGVYGSQRVYNGVPKSPHYGVDVAAPTGTVVRAPAAGKVVLTHDDMFFSGGTLIIDHGMRVSSSFLHLSKILVQNGDWVSPGDPIAEVGATGRVTGPHLDWRMNWRNSRVDPQLLVAPMSP